MKKISLLFLGIMWSISSIHGQTSLEGKVMDDSGLTLPFATLVLYKNDVYITNSETDLDGNYAVSNIEPGTYDVEVAYVGYSTQREVGVLLNAGRTTRLNFTMTTGNVLDEVVIKEYKAPLIEVDNTTSGQTVTAEKIRSMPLKNINAIASTTAGLSSTDGGEVSIRGSRSNATNYYVDGVRVAATDIPAQEIDQLQVITGGIESKYGDVTGGIISITSKGPSQRFSGGFEAETSEFLDDYGYNLLAANVSGPILKKSSGESIIGFRFGGQYRQIRDNSPSALGVYRLSADQIAKIEAEPTVQFGEGSIPVANLLTSADVGEPLRAAPNETDRDYTLNGKLDFRLSQAIDISLSGAYSDSKDRFTPGDGDLADNRWGFLNWVNNPYNYEVGYRGSFRFRHKVGKQGIGESSKDQEEGAEATHSGGIRNAYYSIQLGYEKRNGRVEDVRHEGNLFNYGYFGESPITVTPTASIVTDTSTWAGDCFYSGGVPVELGGDGGLGPCWSHQGNLLVPSEFIPDLTYNSALAQISELNSFVDDPAFTVFNGLFDNVGQVYDRVDKDEEERFTFNVAAGFDLIPGGSENGRHSFQLGLNYEQRINRFHVVAPQDLWSLARIQANRHILGIDETVLTGSTFTQSVPVLTFDPNSGALQFVNQDVEFNQYANLLAEDLFTGNTFFWKVREKLNEPINKYLNTDALKPSDLSLDMFSAGELNDRGLVNYYGYDYLGNKIPTSTKFEDFFTGTREVTGNLSGISVSETVRNYDVAPLQPIYGALYLQDKFSYKDIIFRIGVRADYYDANTKVMIDPYALYDIEQAQEFFSRTSQSKPEAVGNDYKVYVKDKASEEVVGYRNGEQWFLPNGTAVADGNIIFGSGIVYPSYKGKDINGEVPRIQENDFQVSQSFKDYDPQLNIMPRLAFSFPISEDANFFAHYDILVQRPPSGTAATARSYFYFENSERTPLDNPALLPEKTIDYEVGFQQKISGSSAVKLSAYYKELRDMIQRRTYLYIPDLGDYESYGNLDFGTVKGFSLSYDLRRTGNIELTAAYTLQFADGTGSDANSSQGLNARGSIRNLLPLTFDERHRFTATMDYRYSSGKKYNGPNLFGKDIFANAGLNFLFTAVSGRPYTRFNTPQSIINGQGGGYVGSINGARLPWNFDVDLRADKSFSIKLGEERSRALNFNIYLRVENLFNTRNVIGVFPVTGDPEDDGFLVSSFGQDALSTVSEFGTDIINYTASYQWRLLDPGNFTLPRRMFAGVIFDF